MSISAVSICQQALVMIGAQPIASLDDDTTEGIVCRSLYEATVRDELSQYRWRFATGVEQLNRLVATPGGKWGAAYQLPPACLVPSTVYVSGNPIDFDRYEDNIYCNASVTAEVLLEGVYRVDEQFWPPYFERVIVYRLASHLAHSIAQQVDTSDLLDRRAIRHAALARNRDAQGRTATRIDTTRLVRNRSVNSGRFNGTTTFIAPDTTIDTNPFDDLDPLP
jgi:hypothetical protein